MTTNDIALENNETNLFSDAFRRACSYVPTGVAILAGLDAQQKPFGLTVSSLTCVSFRRRSSPFVLTALRPASNRFGETGAFQ